MCLSIPYKIRSINGNIAIVKNDSQERKIDIHLVRDITEGDWVLVNKDYAIYKISEKEALKIKKLINKIRG